jgi:hypothetical protein
MLFNIELIEVRGAILNTLRAPLLSSYSNPVKWIILLSPILQIMKLRLTKVQQFNPLTEKSRIKHKCSDSKLYFPGTLPDWKYIDCQRVSVGHKVNANSE